MTRMKRMYVYIYKNNTVIISMVASGNNRFRRLTLGRYSSSSKRSIGGLLFRTRGKHPSVMTTCQKGNAHACMHVQSSSTDGQTDHSEIIVTNAGQTEVLYLVFKLCIVPLRCSVCMTPRFVGRDYLSSGLYLTSTMTSYIGNVYFCSYFSKALNEAKPREENHRSNSIINAYAHRKHRSLISPGSLG